MGSYHCSWLPVDECLLAVDSQGFSAIFSGIFHQKLIAFGFREQHSVTADIDVSVTSIMKSPGMEINIQVSQVKYLECGLSPDFLLSIITVDRIHNNDITVFINSKAITFNICL